jgi:hypothetical protein
MRRQRPACPLVVFVELNVSERNTSSAVGIHTSDADNSILTAANEKLLPPTLTVFEHLSNEYISVAYR